MSQSLASMVGDRHELTSPAYMDGILHESKLNVMVGSRHVQTSSAYMDGILHELKLNSHGWYSPCYILRFGRSGNYLS